MFAGFYWSDVGYNLSNSFEDYYFWISIFGIISWILTYGVVAIVARIVTCWHNCGPGAWPGLADEMALFVILHIIYHLIRWPMLLIIAYINNPIVMTINYWIDLLVLIIYGIIHKIRLKC